MISDDMEKVEEAVRNIQAGNISDAQVLLEDVIANTPDDYRPEYEEDGTLCIEFWDRSEFLNYVEWHKLHGSDTSVAWIVNTYPRAYYYLGFIHVHQQNYRKALEVLDRGHQLQPENPAFLIEKAAAHAGLGEHEKALSLYEQVPDVGPYTTAQRKAQALRGQGVQLVELNEIEAAENALKKSLEYDPQSEFAFQELAYISHLRSSGRKTEQRLVKTEDMDAGKNRSGNH